MQKSLFLLILGLTISFGSLLGQGRGNLDPASMADRQTAYMDSLLQLDPDTKAWVHEINLEYAGRMMDLRAQHQGDWESMRTAMRTLQAEKRVALAGVLTEAQLQTLDENPPQGPGRRPGGRRPGGGPR